MAAIKKLALDYTEYDEISLLPNQILVVECRNGKERKYWHQFAEKRGWKHLSIHTDKFEPVELYVCKSCGNVEYFLDMPVNCCERDSEVRYCKNCDDEEGRNIMDITDIDDYTGPDADFKRVSDRMLNAVVMGIELPHIPKTNKRKWHRIKKSKIEDGMNY